MKLWAVTLSKKSQKGVKKLPAREREILFALLKDLSINGPLRTNWSNFSPLGIDKYHCHLSYKWVACWETHKREITIEVYYVGSREKAPY